jgi:hypothetical protein
VCTATQSAGRLVYVPVTLSNEFSLQEPILGEEELKISRIVIQMSHIVELCKLAGQIGGLTGAAGGLLVTNLMIGASAGGIHGGNLGDLLIITTFTTGIGGALGTVVGLTFPVSIPLIGYGISQFN